MFKEIHAITFFIFVLQHIFMVNNKTLPARNVQTKNVDYQSYNPTKSYYHQPNVFGPNTYAFGFEVNDKVSGNIQFRDERRYLNGTTQGSYGYVRPDGSVMVTRFLADDESGYLSQSQNFQPGEDSVWQINWPTKKSSKKIMENGDEEEEEKLNLTSILLPTTPIKEEHGIDLNPPALEKELVNPVVLKTIHGETPLTTDTKKEDNSIGFETVNEFIPPGFPIVPFELPGEDLKIKLNDGLGEKPIPILNKTSPDASSSEASSKMFAEDILSPTNSTEKPKEVSRQNTSIDSNSNNFSKTDSFKLNKSSDWYDQLINQTRQEYLEAVQKKS